MKIIEKKILPQFFNDILKNNKRFEYRQDDDNILPGDILILREWDSLYTGRQIKTEVIYVLRNVPQFLLPLNMCIIGFNIID